MQDLESNAFRMVELRAGEQSRKEAEAESVAKEEEKKRNDLKKERKLAMSLVRMRLEDQEMGAKNKTNCVVEERLSYSDCEDESVPHKELWRNVEMLGGELRSSRKTQWDYRNVKERFPKRIKTEIEYTTFILKWERNKLFTIK